MASKVQMLHWTKQLLIIKDEPHFHDLVIRCGGGEVAVHKVIACSHSPVLKAACTGEFAEKDSAKYEMKDCSMKAVRAMVDYMYAGDYHAIDIFGDAPCGSDQSMSLHAQVVALADKYLIEGLQSAAVAKLKQEAMAQGDIGVLFGCVSEAYESESRLSVKLRRLFIDIARQNLTCRSREDKRITQLEETVSRTPAFGSDLLKDFVLRPVVGRCQTCTASELVSIRPSPSAFLCRQCGKRVTPVNCF